MAGTVLTLVFGVVVSVNLGAFLFSVSPFRMTHLVASVLSMYLLFEARLILRKVDILGLMSPALLTLIFHFFLSYLVGITGTAFEPRILQQFDYLLYDIDAAVAQTLALVGVAAFAMLRGYTFALRAARRLRRGLERTPVIRQRLRFDMDLMFLIQMLYVGVVAYAIRSGTYGLLGSVETRAQNADFQQLINLALAAGALSYFLILLRYFERRAVGRSPRWMGVLVVIMIGIHVLTGAISGFKSQIVLPFVIAGFAYFLVTKLVPLHLIAYASVALIVAYSVVEPFRAYLGAQGQPPASVSEAVTWLGTAVEQREKFTQVSDISRGEAIVSRVDLSGMTALAIDYVDQGSLNSERRQEFQASILLAPILAYVPRVIWQNKPSYAEGVWFNQNVRGKSDDKTTSVAMGPIGYLYMAGGTIAVVLGFFGFGVLQALIFEGIGRAGAGGLIVYFSVAAPLVTIPASFGPAITGIIRMLPIAVLVQWLLLRRRRRIGSS